MALYDSTKVTVQHGLNHYIINTYSRGWKHSRSLYLDKVALDSALTHEAHRYIEKDICTYANVGVYKGKVELEVLWLNFNGNDVSGYREYINIPKETFLGLKQGEDVVLLNKNTLPSTKYTLKPGTGDIVAEILKDQKKRRAICKYFRDNSSGAGECVLYPDGRHDFYFRYKNDWLSYNGGIILSQTNKHNRPCVVYSVHT